MYSSASFGWVCDEWSFDCESSLSVPRQLPLHIVTALLWLYVPNTDYIWPRNTCIPVVISTVSEIFRPTVKWDQWIPKLDLFQCRKLLFICPVWHLEVRSHSCIHALCQIWYRLSFSMIQRTVFRIRRDDERAAREDWDLHSAFLVRNHKVDIIT